jgi:hypothetical protein
MDSGERNQRFARYFDLSELVGALHFDAHAALAVQDEGSPEAPPFFAYPV